MKHIILHGGGEHARVVLDSLLSAGHRVEAVFDPKYSGELFGIPQQGAYDPGAYPDALAIVSIGDNAVRKKAVSIMSHAFGNAIDSSAIVSPRATLGVGNMILHRAVIQAGSRLGNHVIINTGAQVDHDCVLEDFVHLAPGVVLCGTVEIGEGTLIGAGTTVLPGRKVGKWSTVGAGSVVTRDIPDHAVAYGNPARVIKTDR